MLFYNARARLCCEESLRGKHLRNFCLKSIVTGLCLISIGVKFVKLIVSTCDWWKAEGVARPECKLYVVFVL